MSRRVQLKEKVEQLAAVPLFATLPKKDLQAIARRMEEVPAPKGTMLCQQDRVGDQFCLIVDGKAVVRRNGRKIAELGSGDFFGEMALIDELPRSATVQASDDSTLLVMHRRDFSTLLDDSPAMARKLLIVMARRLRDADRKLVT